LPKARFIADYIDLFASREIAAEVHARATRRRDRLALYFNSLKASTTPHYRSLRFSTMARAVDTSVGDLADYDRLFGPQDFLDVPHSRSVLSPGAYLVDLLRHHDKYLTGSDLYKRRPELKTVLLDSANTEVQLPQPALVTFLLENLLTKATPGDGLGVDVIRQNTLWNPPAEIYADLAKAVFPPQAPFDLEFERSRLLLDRLGAPRERLYAVFASAPDPKVLTRESLGWSIGRWRISTPAVGLRKRSVNGRLRQLPDLSEQFLPRD